MNQINTQITTQVVTEENIKTVIQEIEDAFYDIPFENSAFQTESFVIAAQITPERAYRSIGLRMNAKLRALNEAKFGRMKEDIDIDELKEKLSDLNLNKWDRMRFEIDIQQKLSNRRFTDKLINDALAELNVLYGHFKALPKFTREQFEQGERRHFEQRLQRQISGISGARESLVNMVDDSRAISEFENNYTDLLLSGGQVNSIDMLTEQMNNLIKPQDVVQT